MQYRRLGDTDIEISEIGFGCGNTAGLMIWGEPEDRVRAAQHAMDLGINYFDTAATYGQGQSEENLGPVLKELREKPLVGSKVALQEEDLGDIRGAVKKSVERSLRRLGLETLDIVHLHNRVITERKPGAHLAIGTLMTYDEMLGEGGVQEALEDLQREGKLRYFGFCAFGGDPPVYNRIVDEGRFKSLLVFYNILNPTSARTVPAPFDQHDYGQVLPRAKAKGIGTVALRVLEAGALSGNAAPHDLNRGGPSSDPDWVKNAERALALKPLLRDGENLAQLAIRFALANQDVSTVLVGFSDLSQIDEAVACVGRPGLSPEDLAFVEKLYQNDFSV